MLLEAIMRWLGAGILSVCLAAALTQAQAQSVSAPSPNGIGDPGVGVGIICNTPQQAERFVGLRGKGADVPLALNTVNTEAKDMKACGVAAVAFLRDQTVATRPMGDRLVQIVRINVVAGFNGTGWQRASAMSVQYAVIEAGGQSI
jgi:hypothetical protein